MRHPDVIAAMAEASLRNGASGVRLESPEHIGAVRRRCPGALIVGLWKRTYPGSSVYITPGWEEIRAVWFTSNDNGKWCYHLPLDWSWSRRRGSFWIGIECEPALGHLHLLSFSCFANRSINEFRNGYYHGDLELDSNDWHDRRDGYSKRWKQHR